MVTLRGIKNVAVGGKNRVVSNRKRLKGDTAGDHHMMVLLLGDKITSIFLEKRVSII